MIYIYRYAQSEYCIILHLLIKLYVPFGPALSKNYVQAYMRSEITLGMHFTALFFLVQGMDCSREAVVTPQSSQPSKLMSVILAKEQGTHTLYMAVSGNN